MSEKLIKTKTPGIYKRGSRYAVIYRSSDGRQRQESARSFDAARALKALRETEVDNGAADADIAQRGFSEYAIEWIGGYQGTGRRGFRELTRRDYKRDLERYAIPFLGGRLRRKVGQITPADIARFIAWLCNDQEQGERQAAARRRKLEDAGRFAAAEAVSATPVHLADATVRRILAPVRSCLGEAMRHGGIRHNPTRGASLPARDAQRAAELGEDDEPDRRALGRGELAALLRVVPEHYKPLVTLLASTGLRISEALALRWQDLELDGSQPRVKIRRAYVKGAYSPPKTKHGRRDVPIGHELVRALRRHQSRSEFAAAADLVFCAQAGQPLHDRNLSARMLKPVAGEAGVGWMGWHTLRHTCASMLFAAGRNPVQVQRWLGHHSPAFTLSTYAHLLDEDFGEPLDLAAETGEGVSRVSARAPEIPVT